MVDIRYALDVLCPSAQFGGSVTANTEEAYNAIRWEDEREKPTWVEVVAVGEPAGNLADQLNAIFEQLQPEAQADLSPLKAAIKLELEQGRNAIARLIIERATVPEELEAVRTQMLGVFNVP